MISSITFERAEELRTDPRAIPATEEEVCFRSFVLSFDQWAVRNRLEAAHDKETQQPLIQKGEPYDGIWREATLWVYGEQLRAGYKDEAVRTILSAGFALPEDFETEAAELGALGPRRMGDEIAPDALIPKASVLGELTRLLGDF